jgi:hypothetical protein
MSAISISPYRLPTVLVPVDASTAAEDSPMPTSIAALATTVQAQPAWLKNTARAAFLVVFMKGTFWVAATWLTLQGFNGF